ncbi:hypothetical protein GCM10022251_32280 [Phytohabitans flavus]|uniref:Uncharacterized protein n=1 Tax=Phytohabitans flavus TaxID=1076124 RepID=A0A6F8XWH6_9ACTN|nr:hypothetical protein Pflav_045730 [Phytohabitans flavus]
MGRGDNADLVVVWRFLDEAAQRVADLGEGQDHDAIQSARIRIDDSIRAAIRAAGGFPRWVRPWLDALLLAVVVWVTATLCGLVGLPSGWTIAVTVLVALVSLLPLFRLADALRDLVNRRGLGPPVPRAASPPTSTVPGEQLLHVLVAARSALAVVMRRRIAAHPWGSAARTAAGFDLLCQRDTRLHFASLADRCVCQAIVSVERWLRTAERDR